MQANFRVLRGYDPLMVHIHLNVLNFVKGEAHPLGEGSYLLIGDFLIENLEVPQK